MLTIIAGSRNARERDVLYALSQCSWRDQISSVISGKAHGADTYGEKYAEAHGIDVIKFPAEWDIYGLSAGPRRNKEMAENADALIAVWDGSSRGTKSMLQYAQHYELRTMIYYYKENTIEYPVHKKTVIQPDFFAKSSNYYAFI